MFDGRSGHVLTQEWIQLCVGEEADWMEMPKANPGTRRHQLLGAADHGCACL